MAPNLIIDLTILILYSFNLGVTVINIIIKYIDVPLEYKKKTSYLRLKAKTCHIGVRFF